MSTKEQTNKEPVQPLTNEELSDWAFVKVMSDHLQTCLRDGRFSQIQVMLKENGFNVTLYNAAKRRKGVS